MRLKWLRLLVPVGALLALALALSSCGDDDDGGDGAATTGRPGGVRPGDRGPGRRQGGRRADGARRGRHRLHGSRRRLLPVHLHGHAGGAPDPAQLGPRRRRGADAGPRRGRAGDLRRRPDDRVHDPRRGALQPARGSRGDRGGRRVRDRALDAARRRQPVRRDSTLGDIVGYDAAREGGRRQPDRRGTRHRGSQRARRQDAADRAQRAAEGRDREGDRPGAVAAGERARAGGVREGVRREEPLDLRPVRRLHRPVHGRERPRDRRADRLHAGQGDQARPQPELGRRSHRGLPPRVPGLDHVPGGIHGHGVGVAEDPQRRRVR